MDTEFDSSVLIEPKSTLKTIPYAFASASMDGGNLDQFIAAAQYIGQLKLGGSDAEGLEGRPRFFR